jgi:hypothetical protein
MPDSPSWGTTSRHRVGATILHRTLTNLFLDRGMRIDHTYQLNTGGNTDFLNMLERERLADKKTSKTEAVTSMIEARGQSIAPDDIHIGPSDYVPWQKDNKICFLRIESTHFGDVSMNLEVRLSVEDSPNSAGVAIDSIRCCKLALDNGLSGAIIEPAAFFSKHPPKQIEDRQAPGVFVAASLQRFAGMGEEDALIEQITGPIMGGHLPALVSREGEPRVRRQGAHYGQKTGHRSTARVPVLTPKGATTASADEASRASPAPEPRTMQARQHEPVASIPPVELA